MNRRPSGYEPDCPRPIASNSVPEYTSDLGILRYVGLICTNLYHRISARGVENRVETRLPRGRLRITARATSGAEFQRCPGTPPSAGTDGVQMTVGWRTVREINRATRHCQTAPLNGAHLSPPLRLACSCKPIAVSACGNSKQCGWRGAGCSAAGLMLAAAPYP